MGDRGARPPARTSDARFDGGDESLTLLLLLPGQRAGLSPPQPLGDEHGGFPAEPPAPGAPEEDPGGLGAGLLLRGEPEGGHPARVGPQQPPLAADERLGEQKPPRRGKGRGWARPPPLQHPLPGGFQPGAWGGKGKGKTRCLALLCCLFFFFPFIFYFFFLPPIYYYRYLFI